MLLLHLHQLNERIINESTVNVQISYLKIVFDFVNQCSPPEVVNSVIFECRCTKNEL